MKEKELATSQLREVLTYVARFRHSTTSSPTTFVIILDDGVFENNDTLSVAGDISLLHAVGIRIALALGSTDRSDYAKKRKERYTRLQSLAEQLCRSINTVHYRPSTALKPGSGELQNFALNVGDADINAELLSAGRVCDVLDKRLVPIIVAKPKNRGADESWFGSLLRVTANLCSALLPCKLIYLSCVDGIFLRDRTLLREAQPDEIRRLVTDGVITGQFAEFASTAEQVINAGVQRVHFINGKISGGLLSEVFTKDGVGTMIYLNPYQEIRSARTLDINGILNLLCASEEHNLAQRNIEKMIEAQLANYRVAVKDGGVIACGCLRCFPAEGRALINSFAVDKSYLGSSVGELMLQRLFEEARGKGVTLLTLVSPHTGQWWLSQKFTTGKISDLPAELQTSYNSPTAVILAKRFKS